MASQVLRQQHFEEIIEDHRRLRELLGLIGQSLANRKESVYRVINLMHDLEEDLRAHFDHEEQGGYLHEALSRAPHFARRASRLKSEHSQLLLTVHQMSDGLRNFEWETVKDQFQAFALRFDNHESNENRLVQDALLRDIEAED